MTNKQPTNMVVIGGVRYREADARRLGLLGAAAHAEPIDQSKELAETLAAAEAADKVKAEQALADQAAADQAAADEAEQAKAEAEVPAKIEKKSTAKKSTSK